MQNFSKGPHRDTIRNEGVIYSATGEGRVGIIDAEDIAASAIAVLKAETAPNTDAVLTGPDTLSYGDIATFVSAITGHPVRHVSLDDDELAERFVTQGLPPAYARPLVGLDAAIRSGAEDRTTDAVVRITGHEPTSFQCFAKAAAQHGVVDRKCRKGAISRWRQRAEFSVPLIARYPAVACGRIADMAGEGGAESTGGAKTDLVLNLGNTVLA